jgi:predicted GH43/DUF377 family glycosyl hydrolase
MDMIESKIRRLPVHLRPDPTRVLVRPFLPSLIVKPSVGQEPNQRIVHIFSRVMLLEESQVAALLDQILHDFGGRHKRVREIFAERFQQVRGQLPTDHPISEARQLLLGSYFTNEYSLESSALFNPSIVPHPDQGGVPHGHLRFILSLRATGEGHISSITFRSGMISPDGDITIDPVSRFVQQPRPCSAPFERELFRRKLHEIGVDRGHVQRVLDGLPQEFLMADLLLQIRRLRAASVEHDLLRGADRAMLLARSNYSMSFEPATPISERVIFPHAPSESNGIEDARFVRFTHEGGRQSYIATYTAYDGSVVLPQMVETPDFNDFEVCTLNGPAVRNKGLALFPRKIGGDYVMLGRQDSENIHLMTSDNLHFWHESEVILRPAEAWEFIQLGNCGSPIELDQGWLVLTHGVGPMRKYCIGAILLDRDDPSRVLGRLREPLLRPAPDEREGYVPNVVYSCGALVHHGILVLPYAVSDTSTRFATIAVADLLAAMDRR